MTSLLFCLNLDVYRYNILRENENIQRWNMLFIIDIQNNYIDADKGQMYVKDSEKPIDGIIDKIDEYRKKGDEIFYTLDIFTASNRQLTEESSKGLENNNDLKNIKIKEHLATEDEKWAFSLPDKLRPHLKDEECLKKSHYALPPEVILEIQKRFNKERKIIKEIEFVGVETHICVLANAICIRSAFPDAKIIIDSSLCRSNDMEDHERSLNIMKALGMNIRS